MARASGEGCARPRKCSFKSVKEENLDFKKKKNY